LFGQSLIVWRRTPYAGKPVIYCERRDGTISGFPAWMTDARVCETHSSGLPQVSVHGLVNLRGLLDLWLAESRAKMPDGATQVSHVGPALQVSARRR
jgi:hypothetical protein